MAFVQTVLVIHQSHHTVQQSSHSSNNDQLSTYTVKCVVCDFISTRRSEAALLSSTLQLSVFEKVIPVFNPIYKPDILHPFLQEYANKGPPTA
jgi:hypothetical protein